MKDELICIEASVLEALKKKHRTAFWIGANQVLDEVKKVGVVIDEEEIRMAVFGAIGYRVNERQARSIFDLFTNRGEK